MACLIAFKTLHTVLHVLGKKVPSQHSLLIQYWPNVGLAKQIVAQSGLTSGQQYWISSVYKIVRPIDIK